MEGSAGPSGPAPSDPAAAASEGLAHLCLGDPSAAAEALRQALALDPDQPRVREMPARLGSAG